MRCNPANSKAKLFYANFLHSKMGRTDDAIQTMKHGLEFLDINDKLGRDYLERYFQFLQLRERDAEVIEQGLKCAKTDVTVGECAGHGGNPPWVPLWIATIPSHFALGTTCEEGRRVCGSRWDEMGAGPTENQCTTTRPRHE